MKLKNKIAIKLILSTINKLKDDKIDIDMIFACLNTIKEMSINDINKIKKLEMTNENIDIIKQILDEYQEAEEKYFIEHNLNEIKN